jgi:LDH2 family malate/lactate/ureidoglycolate dehydrogenase
VRETATSLVIDSDNSMGQWVGMRAMERVIDKARRNGGACKHRIVAVLAHLGPANRHVAYTFAPPLATQQIAREQVLALLCARAR